MGLTTELHLNSLCTTIIILIKTPHLTYSSTYSLIWWLVNKTWTTISLLLLLSYSDTRRPHLLVCPSPLLFKHKSISSQRSCGRTYRPEKLGTDILVDFLDDKVEAGRSLQFAQYHTVMAEQCAQLFSWVCTSLFVKNSNNNKQTWRYRLNGHTEFPNINTHSQADPPTCGKTWQTLKFFEYFISFNHNYRQFIMT